MFALARRITSVADGHAEAGEYQRARERAHRAGIAAQQRFGFVQQCRFVLGQQDEGRAPVRRSEQMMREQPVRLRRGAAQRIAEPRADHPRGRCRQHAEVHEDTHGRNGRQRHLVAVDRDGRVLRRVAVHRRRGREDRVGLAILRSGIFAEVVDRSRTDRDQRVRVRACVPNDIHGGGIGVRYPVEHDRDDRGYARERPLDPLSQHGARRRIADHSDAASQPQRCDEVRLVAGKTALDRHGPNGDLDRRAAVRVRPFAAQQLIERVRRSRGAIQSWTPTLAASFANSAAALPPEGVLAPWDGPAALMPPSWALCRTRRGCRGSGRATTLWRARTSHRTRPSRS